MKAFEHGSDLSWTKLPHLKESQMRPSGKSQGRSKGWQQACGGEWESDTGKSKAGNLDQSQPGERTVLPAQDQGRHDEALEVKGKVALFSSHGNRRTLLTHIKSFI